MTGLLLAAGYALLFIFIIRKHRFYHVDGISKNAFTVTFIAKIISGFAFWAVYTYYGNYANKSDAFLYFDDGKILYSALFNNPLDYVKLLLGFDDESLKYYINQTGYWSREFNQGLYNETRTVIRFNALTCLFSFGYFHVHTVFMCFVSFTGLVGIYKSFHHYFRNKKYELFFSVFFLPSVLFWSSGVLKEGLIMFSMGLLIYHWFKFLSEGFSFKRLMRCVLIRLIFTPT